MMNHVTITYQPLRRYPTIAIDGDHISPYSDLASCENKDLHVCAARLLRLLDDEIGGDYDIEMVATPFHIAFVSMLAENSELCKGVRGSSIPMHFDIDEIISFAKSIIQNHSFDVAIDTNVYVTGDALDQQHSAAIRNDDQFDLYVCNEMPTEPQRGKTIVLLSDHFNIRNTRGNNIVEIPVKTYASFIDYYRSYTKEIPMIEAAFSQSRYASLSKEESMYIDAYTSQQPRYIFEVGKTLLDVGESTSIVFSIIPKSARGEYTLTADNPKLIKIQGNSIEAKQDGTLNLMVVDNKGNRRESISIVISKHSFVTSIRLVPSNTSIEVGKKGQIEAYIVPENAEDAQKLEWNSSDTDVLHVKSTGEMVALKPGTSVVTVSATNCKESVTITVCPSLEKISLSKSNITIELGKSETIECHLYPEDAAHGEIIWELSNDGMGSLNVSNNGKTCSFTATTSSLLKGNIKCRIKGTEKNATVGVEIVPENRPMGLVTCAIVFSVLGLIGSFLIPLIWAGGGGIGGFFADIFLPVGIVLSMIGKSKTNNQEKVFGTMLTLDLIFTGVMFFIAVVACTPRH